VVKKYNMKRIRLTEKQYDKIISELYKSTYNSASSKVMGESDLDYWKDYAESKKQSDERAKEGGILGKLLSDTKMDKNENVYTKWFPTRFAVDALGLGSEAHIPLFKEFTQYCKKKFGLRDKADIYMIWLDYTHSVVKMIPDQTVLKELYRSTYNSAAAKAMEGEDEELALDFLRHSNDMGIEDELKYNPKKVVHKDDEHIVIDKDLDWEDEVRYDDDDVSYEDDEWMVIDTDEPKYDFYGVGPSDLDADGIPDDVDDELSVDRFDITQRIKSELNTMLNEGSKGENYMFFSNLKQMRRQLDIMINEFDSNMVNDVINNGHDWADDHITEAKVNIDQVFDFFMNKLKDEDGEYKDDEEFEFPVDDDYDDTEDYYTSHDKYGNSINDYPK
jgi:hypothetical protein